MSGSNGQGPDLSRIVSLIMQNPDLIRQVEALAKQNTEETSDENVQNAVTAAQTEEAEAPTVSAAAQPRSTDKREKRTQLLSALRPYVSEKRGKTLDTLLGALDLWDLVGRG